MDDIQKRELYTPQILNDVQPEGCFENKEFALSIQVSKEWLGTSNPQASKVL